MKKAILIGMACLFAAGCASRSVLPDAKEVKVTAKPESGKPIEFTVRVRIDTPKEREYFRHGGILQYVLRQLATK